MNKQAKKNYIVFKFYYVFRKIWVTSTLDIFSRIVCDYTWLHVTTHNFQLFFIKTSTFRLSSFMFSLTSSAF